MSTELLQVSGIRVQVAGTVIVPGATFEVPTGRVIALVGPNGAGKSTLLRAMAGVQPIADGSVRLGESDLLALGRRDRARVLALVEQDSQSEFALTVRQAVDLGRTPHRSLWGFDAPGDVDAVAEAIKAAGAEELAGRQLGTLSGGERQRVHLARALAQQPRLLMLDEPTNHLDVKAQLSTLGLMRDLAASGMTVVAALHDLNLAAQFCDQVVILTGGEVRAVGGIDEVLTPEVISRTYGVVADVLTHPRTGRPLIAFS